MDILKTLIADSNWLTVDKAQYMCIIILVQQLLTAKVSMIRYIVNLLFISF